MDKIKGKLGFGCMRLPYIGNEIDIDRALKSKERAEKRINSKDDQIDIVRAEASLKRAIMRLNVAKYN